MVNNVLTSWSHRGTAVEVLEAMEIQLETVDTAKTILVAQIKKEFNDFVGLLLYAT